MKVLFFSYVLLHPFECSKADPRLRYSVGGKLIGPNDPLGEGIAGGVNTDVDGVLD
jgi:hypothetical protein